MSSSCLSIPAYSPIFFYQTSHRSRTAPQLVLTFVLLAPQVLQIARQMTTFEVSSRSSSVSTPANGPVSPRLRLYRMPRRSMPLQSLEFLLQVRCCRFGFTRIDSISVSKPTHVPPRLRSGASTSSESSSESCSSEDATLASLAQPQRPGSATLRGSGPPHRPTKPLVDIGQLVGENIAIPPCASEPSNPSQPSAETDNPTARYRKTSFGLRERLSALASGLGGLRPSRSKSPDSTSDSRDEAFTAPDILEKSPSSQSRILNFVHNARVTSTQVKV